MGNSFSCRSPRRTRRPCHGSCGNGWKPRPANPNRPRNRRSRPPTTASAEPLSYRPTRSSPTATAATCPGSSTAIPDTMNEAATSAAESMKLPSTSPAASAVIGNNGTSRSSPSNQRSRSSDLNPSNPLPHKPHSFHSLLPRTAQSNTRRHRPPKLCQTQNPDAIPPNPKPDSSSLPVFTSWEPLSARLKNRQTAPSPEKISSRTNRLQ